LLARFPADLPREVMLEVRAIGLHAAEMRPAI
jgi:hypothetical protein